MIQENYILGTLEKGKLAPLKSVLSETSVGSERRIFFLKNAIAISFKGRKTKPNNI